MNPRIDEVTEYKLCKRGHERTPENLTKSGGCKKCEKICRQTPERTASRNAWHRAHNQTAERKAGEKIRRQTPERKAYIKAYENTPTQRLKQHAYTQKQRDGLSDHYIRTALQIRAGQATQDLIEIKRLTLQLKRSMKNVNRI